MRPPAGRPKVRDRDWPRLTGVDRVSGRGTTSRGINLRTPNSMLREFYPQMALPTRSAASWRIGSITCW